MMGCIAVYGWPTLFCWAVDLMDNTRARERLAYIDVLNVLASLSVVVLHFNCFWDGPAQGRSWISANLIETALYWPVPVFMMITGATLLGYEDRSDTKTYLKRRFSRTLVPFLAWSFAGFVLWYVRQRTSGVAVDVTPLDVLNGIITNQYVPMYWYFPLLFGVYLSIPILAPIRNNKRLCEYAIVVGATTVCALPLICALVGIQWNTALAPPAASGYVVYVLLGWYIVTYNIPADKRGWVYALGVAGFLVQLVGTFVLSTPEDGVNTLFKSYLNLPALLQATAVFTFARNVDFSGGVCGRVASVCRALSPLSLGVYLMHYFVLTTVLSLGVVDPHSICWRTLGAAAAYAFCAAVTMAMKKVPVLRCIVP